jgi:hypothetical protein
MVLSPWHIHFGRGAWEANLSLTLTLAGILFFLKSFKRPKYILFSAILFSLTLLTYQGAKLSTAIVVFSLVAVYYKEFLKLPKKTLALSVLLGFLISMPIVTSLVSGKTGRLKVFSLFSYPRPVEYTQEFLDQAGVAKGSLAYNLIYSEPLFFTRSILGRYFNHFSAKFLFFEGDWQNPRHGSPNQGMLTLVDIVLLPLGLLFISKSVSKKHVRFILIWLVLSPLPSALSRDEVHGVRALNMVVPLILVLSFGVYNAVTYLKKHTSILIVSLFLYSLSFIYFLDAYFIHLPNKDSKLWFYGYKQVMEEFIGKESQYDSIKIEQSFAQPYIFYLFYSKYDPAKYQAQNSYQEVSEFDVGYVTRIDNIVFEKLEWTSDLNVKNSLTIGSPYTLSIEFADPKKVEFVKDIYYLDNTLALRIIGSKK